jgi:peptide/nickel transport system substrate-binding protein
VIPNGTLGIDPQTPLADFDIKKAKDLLAQAGYPNGLTVKSLGSTQPTLSHIMEGVQAQLRKAGINLDVEPMDHATWHAQIRKDLSPITLYQAFRFPVADAYLTQFFHSRSTVATPTAVTNFSHCSVADQEIDAARNEPDAEKQKALWRTAQRKIANAVCGVPFSESPNIWAWQGSLDLGYPMKGSLNLTPHITEKTHFIK